MLAEVKASLFALIGATGEEHPRVLGMMSPEEVDQELNDMKVAEKRVTIIQKGFVRRLGKLGVSQKVLEEPLGPQVPQSDVVSQGSEESVPKLSTEVSRFDDARPQTRERMYRRAIHVLGHTAEETPSTSGSVRTIADGHQLHAGGAQEC